MSSLFERITGVRAVWPLLAGGAALLIFDVILVMKAHEGSQMRAHEAFEQAAGERAKAIDYRLQDVLFRAQNIATFAGTSSTLSEAEFRKVAESGMFRSGLMAATIIANVPHSARAGFEAAHRQMTNAPDYVISELLPDRSKVPAPVRDFYFPVMFTSLEAARFFEGVDMAGGGVRGYLHQAKDTREQVVTEIGGMLTVESTAIGFRIVSPIFSGEGSRHAQLRGFVLSSYDLTALLNDALASFEDVGLDLRVSEPDFSNDEKGVELLSGLNLDGEERDRFAVANGLKFETRLAVAGDKNFVLTIVPVPGAFEANYFPAIGTGLVAGLVSVIFLGSIGALLYVRDRLRVNVEDRTREIAAKSAELERSNEALQQFASIASHDLKDPLRKIQYFSDRVTDKYSDMLDCQGRDYLGHISDAASRMTTLISDLLNYSLVSAYPTPFKDVALQTVLDEVLSDLHVLISESSATIARDPLPVVSADALQMRQVLQNLISNAIKYRRKGVAPLIRVTYTAETDPDDGHWHVIEISDNGMGFDEGYAEHIFAPMQRLVGVSEIPGTGIGLAICRKIIERHGGEISATGVDGEGAAIRFTLPLIRMEKVVRPTEIRPDRETEKPKELAACMT